MANKKDQLTSDLSKFVEQSQWAKAVQVLESLVALEPANAQYYLRMGDYSVKAGTKASAVKAYYQAADMFVKAGFSVKGIATYKMILRIAPEETQATKLMKAINTNPAIATPSKPPPPPAVELKVPPPVAPPPPPPAVELKVPPPVAPPPPPPVVELKVPPPVAPPPPEPVMELDISPTVEQPIEITLDIPEIPDFIPTGEKKSINALFASFTEDEFGAIVDKLEPLQFMDGERIMAEGDEGDAMYLISRGVGRVVKEVEEQELVLAELTEGEFFGEMSLLVGGPRSASVFAHGETEVLRLKSADLFEIMKRYPRMESVLEEFYESRSKATRQKIRELRK